MYCKAARPTNTTCMENVNAYSSNWEVLVTDLHHRRVYVVSWSLADGGACGEVCVNKNVVGLHFNTPSIHLPPLRWRTVQITGSVCCVKMPVITSLQL